MLLFAFLLLNPTWATPLEEWVTEVEDAFYEVDSLQTGTRAGCSQGDLRSEKSGESCHLYFSWGHCTEVEACKASNPEQNRIIQGCSIRQAGCHELKKRGRFQSGPNGDWFEKNYQNSANGGLNLIDAERDLELPPTKLGLQREFAKGLENELIRKNNLIGFMRLTQYNYLEMVDYALEEMLSKQRCGSVKIKFECASEKESKFDEMGDSEWKRRIRVVEDQTLFSKLMPFYPKVKPKTRKAIEALERFELLKDCFSGSSHPPYPLKCGEEFVVKSGMKILPHCRKFMKRIRRIPEIRDKKSEERIRIPEPESYLSEPVVN